MDTSFLAVLAPVAALTRALSVPVHPTYFPIPLVPVLHAARISLAFRGQKTRLGTRFSRGADMAGFLTMCWGGSVATHVLLGLPIPQILSSVPWAIYCSTHLVLTSLFDSGAISYPPPKLVDTVCPLVDAIARSAAITAAVEACRAHAHPAVRSSLFVQLFLGAVASAGGGVTAGTLGVWEHDWRLRRPAFVDGGIIPTLDVWGGSLAALVYGFFQITHPWYGEVYEAYGFKPVALLTPLAARSMAVLVLTSLYVTRVYHTHYAPKRTPPAVKQDGHPKAD